MSAEQMGSSLTLDQFFVHVISVLMFPKGPPFNFFDILQQNGRSKNPKGSPFYIFGTMRLTGDFKKVSKKIGKFFSIFFSFLRHSATKKGFPQRFRLHFFWSFVAEWMLKNTKRSPFTFFRNCETFFQFCFSPKGPPFIFLMICDRRDEKCQSVPLAR